MSITPDTKDWTWVLTRPCPECGFDASSFRRDEVGHAIRANASEWAPLLQEDGAALRPTPDKWSCLEYACHVRDVLRLFGQRLELMLTQHNPTFENWDQDATALADHYRLHEPNTVAREIFEAASSLASRYDSVSGTQWARPGTRSNGSAFTVETLAIYGLHDPIHHLWDVTTADPS